MDVTTCQTFLAAAATGSFAAAAERVHASPSSVTERIRQLEHRVGARLFERNKRGCRLTAQGKRFLGPARQMVRAWEVARHEVGLPERFTRTIAFGGQYVLWPALVNWLASARDASPELAFRVTAGASPRLNRDLSEGVLDFAVLYDPIFRADIGVEPLYDDRLIMVTGGDPQQWREGYLPIEWGRTIGPEIAAQVDTQPQQGLTMDLGGLSAQWLSQQGMSGYMPERTVRTMVESGALKTVPGTPDFEYPIYACWRRDLENADREGLLTALRGVFA